MDPDLILQFLSALALVLALIGIIAFVARRFGFGRGTMRSGRQRRLGVVEVVNLDAKRRLVLIRRDGVEHLLLVGGPADLVVESGIGPHPHGPRSEDRFFQPAPAFGEQDDPARTEAPA
jgi:flagellar protein FliO/FliZ